MSGYADGGVELVKWAGFSYPTSADEGLVAILIKSAVATCHTRFGASSSDVGPRHQEQNREGVKAQSRQYMASWVRLLLL